MLFEGEAAGHSDVTSPDKSFTVSCLVDSFNISSDTGGTYSILEMALEVDSLLLCIYECPWDGCSKLSVPVTL
jgi:hypothetical protein